MQSVANRIRQFRVATLVLLLAGASNTFGEQAPIHVALYHGPGTGGKGPTNLMQQLSRPPEMTIQQVTAEEIKGGALTNYQVVIFAGGMANKQAEALGEKGREAVRSFVGSGGGYIGICAGAYLATAKSYGLKIIDAQTVSPKWQRGRGEVKIELTKQGQGILPKLEGEHSILYVNGPVVEPAGLPDLEDYQALAVFRTELAKNGTPAGVMVNSPAIFAGPFGKGRVVCISPHPEQTKGLDGIVLNSVKWAGADAIETRHASANH